MKTILTTAVVFIGVMMTGCATTSVNYLSPAPMKVYQKNNLHAVHITQAGKDVPTNNGVYLIDKDTFEITFEHSGELKVLLSAWTSPDTFNDFYSERPFNSLPGFENTGMAEVYRNEKLRMTLSSNSPSAWFYDDQEINRFDKNITVNKRVLSTRTIQNFNYQKKDSFPVDQAPFDDLYLSILEYKYNSKARQYDVFVKSRIHLKFK